MRKTSLSFAALLLTLVSTAAFAGEDPRHQPQDRDRRLSPVGLSSFTLVVNPDGGANAPSSEAMHYLLDRDSIANHVIYGFTSLEGRERFATKREQARSTNQPRLKTCADARFNKVAYGTGTDWLLMYCGQTNSYLPDPWNDVISYVEASGSWTILYKCYYFSTSGTCNTLAIAGGNTINDLNTYGFNNYTSSIKVCPEGITFTECQNF